MKDSKDKSNLVNINKVEEIVNNLKKEGILGELLICKICDNVKYNPENDNRIYPIQVMTFNGEFNYVINPITKKFLKLKFESEDKSYRNGDFIICDYYPKKSNENLSDLIEINPTKVRKLLNDEDIGYLYKLEFNQYLDKFLEYEKDLEKINPLKLEIKELNEDKQKLEDEKNFLEEYNETLCIEIDENEDELKKIKILKNETKNNLENFKEENKNLVIDIQKNSELLEELKNNISKELKNEKNLKLRIKSLEKYFLFELNNEQENNIKENFIFENDINKISSIIRKLLYHYENENLIYTEKIIRKFYKALISDQIVLLTGPSGTGKSSLVNQIGKVINEFKVYNIPVQSNWTDVQDLLGFFNPLENKYISTSFLDALVQARLEPEKIHIICLDEMNLSHVEYYLSTLLSVREKKIGERYLELYSQRIYQNEKIELLKILNIDDKELMELEIENLNNMINSLNKSDRESARNKFELLYYYQAKFEIPSNVRFVGTLNMDETVKPLSPKVIDRSFVIELDYLKNYKENKLELENNKLDGILSIDINQFLKYTKDEEFNNNEELYVNRIEELLDEISMLSNVMINGRARKHIKIYASIEPFRTEFFDNQVDEEILNEIIESKILPRIQFNKNDEIKMNAFENFIKKLPNLSSKQKAIDMKNKKRIIQFWGK